MALPLCGFTVPSTLKPVAANAVIETKEGMDVLSTEHWKSKKRSKAHRPEEVTA